MNTQRAKITIQIIILLAVISVPCKGADDNKRSLNDALELLDKELLKAISTASLDSREDAIKRLMPGQHFVYYAGAAWSKHDVRSQKEWDIRLKSAIEAANAPLTIKIVNK